MDLKMNLDLRLRGMNKTIYIIGCLNKKANEFSTLSLVEISPKMGGHEKYARGLAVLHVSSRRGEQEAGGARIVPARRKDVRALQTLFYTAPIAVIKYVM